MKQSFLTAFFWLMLIIAATNAQSTPKGFNIIGAPYAAYKDGEGLTGGAGLFMYQYGDGSIQPFKWNMTVNLEAGTQGSAAGYIFFDIRNICGDSRLVGDVGYKRYIQQDFHGLGNSHDYHPEFSDPDAAEFKHKRYNAFYFEYPYLLIDVLTPLRGEWQSILGGGILHRTLDTYGPPNLLAETSPRGLAGGWSNFLRAGVVYDSRDHEAAPTSGAWSDIIFEHASPLLGSDYQYSRLTLIDRRYFPLFPRLVYAQRLLFESLSGQPPFYDMALISGSYKRQDGLGGANSLRGVPRLLYVGRSKMLANLELRLRLFNTTILRQPLTFFAHTYFDVGRVWMNELPNQFGGRHHAEGVGLHVLWKKDTMGYIDIGRSMYSNLAVYIGFNNLF